MARQSSTRNEYEDPKPRRKRSAPTCEEKPSRSRSARQESTEVEAKQPRRSRQPRPDSRLPAAASKLPALRKTYTDLEFEVDKALKEDQPGGPEEAFKNQYRMMLRTNALLMRRLEEQLADTLTSRDIYALSNLMSQQREVIADLRSMIDMSNQVEHIRTQVVVAMSSGFGQTVTDLYYQLNRLLGEVAEEKKVDFASRFLIDLMKNTARSLQQHQSDAMDRLNYIMLGEGADAPAKKSRRR